MKLAIQRCNILVIVLQTEQASRINPACMTTMIDSNQMIDRSNECVEICCVDLVVGKKS